MSRLLVFRQENRSRRRKRTLVTAVVLCSLIGAVVITVARYEMHRQLSSATVAVASETVKPVGCGYDPRQTSQAPCNLCFLPAAVVRVTIILPRFSPPGQYAVAVTQDQNGNGVVAQRSAPATINWRPRISVHRTGPAGGQGGSVFSSNDPRAGSGVILLSFANQVSSPPRPLNSRLSSNPGICLGNRLKHSMDANPSWQQIRFACEQFRRRWPTFGYKVLSAGTPSFGHPPRLRPMGTAISALPRSPMLYHSCQNATSK